MKQTIVEEVESLNNEIKEINKRLADIYQMVHSSYEPNRELASEFFSRKEANQFINLFEEHVGLPDLYVVAEGKAAFIIMRVRGENRIDFYCGPTGRLLDVDEF